MSRAAQFAGLTGESIQLKCAVEESASAKQQSWK